MLQEDSSDYKLFAGYIYRSMDDYKKYIESGRIFNKLTKERNDNMEEIKQIIDNNNDIKVCRLEVKQYLASFNVGINLYFFRTPGGSTLRYYVNAGIGKYDLRQRLELEGIEGINLKEFGRSEGTLSSSNFNDGKTSELDISYKNPSKASIFSNSSVNSNYSLDYLKPKKEATKDARKINNNKYEQASAGNGTPPLFTISPSNGR